jgi:predicted O-methyltransferase YrrM
MQHLEALDSEQRRLGVPAHERLCAVTPDCGRFLALWAAAAPKGACLEVGTGGGYSGLWLALACAERGHKLTTFELEVRKVKWARETFREAGVESLIDLVVGDAKDHLHRYTNVAFCFLDAAKKEYMACYETVLPNMVNGGILVADNVVSHRDDCEPFIRHVFADPRVDAAVVPIGKGEMLCRKR